MTGEREKELRKLLESARGVDHPALAARRAKEAARREKKESEHADRNRAA